MGRDKLFNSFSITSCGLSLQNICALLFTSGTQCGTGEIQFPSAALAEKARITATATVSRPRGVGGGGGHGGQVPDVLG